MLEMNGGHADDSERDGDPARPAVQGREFAFPGPPEPPWSGPPEPWSGPPEPWSGPPEPWSGPPGPPPAYAPPAYAQPAGTGAAASQPAAADGVWASQPAGEDGLWASQPAAVDGQANGQGRPKGLRRWPRATLATLIVAGLGAAGAGGTALALEMTRHATSAEAQAAAQAEVDSRWQRLAAGQIFPRQLGYTTSAGTRFRATLVGIAPRATCAQATDPVMARALVRDGCVTVLRATYAEGSGALVATAGIAVMPSSAAAERAFSVTDANSSAGVRAVSFAGTVANLFGDAQRQVFSMQNQGPYIFFVSAGYADGRPATPGFGELRFNDLSSGMMDGLIATMISYRNPCGEKDIRC
jgi:hypothetical protein